MEPYSNNDIYLYTAKGADEFCVKETTKSFEEYLGEERKNRLIPINDMSYITSKDWFRNTKAIVFPGGSGYDMAIELEKGAAKKIYEFVNSHQGSYIGFCAGGFIAGDAHFRRSNGQVTNLSLVRDMKLVDIPLYAPALDLGDTKSLKLSSATIREAKIKDLTNTDPYSVYWNGGGYYQRGYNSNAFAWYTNSGEVSEHQAAALHVIRNGGNVVVSHVHPEIRLQDDSRFNGSISKQKSLFSQICTRAGL